MVDKATDIKLRIISLFRSNYLAHYYVREMALLLKKSHVTLLPHLHALTKENILKVKMVGKNKVYTLHLENILVSQYLCMSEHFESVLYQEQFFLIKKIHSELSTLMLPGSCILFGSYAKKTFTKESDIDLFYLGELKEEDILKIKAIGKMYGKVIGLKSASLKHFRNGLRKKDALLMEILKHHIILQNPDLFITVLWGYYYEIRA